MMVSKNLELIKNLYAQYKAGPERAVKYLGQHLTEDVVWSTVADPRMPGLKFATDRRGTTEVSQYFQDLASEWQLLDLEIHHFTAQEDRVIVYGTGHWKNLLTEKVVVTDKVDIFRIDGEKIVEFRELFDSASVVAASKS